MEHEAGETKMKGGNAKRKETSKFKLQNSEKIKASNRPVGRPELEGILGTTVGGPRREVEGLKGT